MLQPLGNMPLSKQPTEIWTYLLPNNKNVGALSWSKYERKKWKCNSSSVSEPCTLAALFIFLPFRSSWGKMADGHMETKWQREKVTSSETGHLSSYLCTPNGSQQQRRWCQTGRSSTGCWMCCSAAVGLSYLCDEKALSKRRKYAHLILKLMDAHSTRWPSGTCFI